MDSVSSLVRERGAKQTEISRRSMQYTYFSNFQYYPDRQVYVNLTATIAIYEDYIL